jgi:hypothetical protein
LVKVRPLLQRVGSALELIGVEPDAATLAALRHAETTGRPPDSQSVLAGIERRLRRRVRPQRRGLKPRDATQAGTMTLFPQRSSAIGKVSPQFPPWPAV